MWAERRSPSAPVWLLILALHVGVLCLLNMRRLGPAATLRDWSELRFIPFREAPVPAPIPTTPVHAPQAHAQDMAAAPAMAPAPPEPVDIAEPAPAEAAPPDAGPPPLQLTLPAQLLRQPALDDPRGNTHISRFGQRIANELGGDGRWTEERMDADTVRLRRGNACINLHRNRTAGRQPFDEASAPTPWGATPAYRCERR